MCFQETDESWKIGQDLQGLQHLVVITGTDVRPEELQIHVYVEHTLASMVPLSLRHVDQNFCVSIVFYSNLIQGKIESSSLGQELSVFHHVLQPFYSIC